MRKEAREELSQIKILRSQINEKEGLLKLLYLESYYALYIFIKSGDVFSRNCVEIASLFGD